MVYAPQRRHAVSSLAMTTHALGLLQHLYTPNLLILAARLLAQVQLTVASVVHPTRSLLALGAMLILMNFTAALLHLLDFVGGMNGGKGLMLDFIGQSNPASLTRVLLLDLLLLVLQLTALVISFITNHGDNLPSSSHFPLDDLLLPPDDSHFTSTVLQDEADFDLEEGKAHRRRRQSRGPYEAVESNTEVWLDEDEDIPEAGPSRRSSERTKLLSTSAPKRRRLREPPLIFSLSLSHLINLIVYLPSPNPPPRAFSGGTPSATPPQTPGGTSPLLATTDLPTDGESDEENDAAGARSPSGRRARRSRGAAGVVGDIGPIPGEYRTGTGRGDGG
ncbi:hypothetical protein BCR39DRAFT_521365 [Naematelia encephala]|uniref:DUF1746 domain-containing protein n=1 Tax=Naematelia encephala TaxID=71784 RepID=A0A1Y2BE71_9TREE|nr:hypothetical protein BCR39DRAFT_521365 [Naematelia encephala]